MPPTGINPPYIKAFWLMVLAPGIYTLFLALMNMTDWGSQFINIRLSPPAQVTDWYPAIARYNGLLTGTPYEENLPTVASMFFVSNTLSVFTFLAILSYRLASNRKIFTSRVRLAIAPYKRSRIGLYFAYALSFLFALYGPLDGLDSEFQRIEFGPQTGGFSMLWVSLCHALAFGALLWWIDEKLAYDE